VGEHGFTLRPHFAVTSLLTNLVIINGMLALFNLLPAFPMDGGRVLRALLARKYGFLAATEKAAWVGRWLALLLGLFGVIVLHRFWFAVIALFIYFAGTQELAAVRLRAAYRQPPFDPFAPRGRAHQPPSPPVEVRPAPLSDAEAAERLAALARKLDEIRGTGPAA